MNRHDEPMPGQPPMGGSGNPREMRSLKRSLRVTQILCIVLSVLIVILLLAAGRAAAKYGPEAQVALANLDTVAGAADQISEVDLGAVAQDISDINDTLGGVDWEEVTEQLNGLDVDAINETLSGINPDELEQAIENLNSAAETLSRLGALFGR